MKGNHIVRDLLEDLENESANESEYEENVPAEVEGNSKEKNAQSTIFCFSLFFDKNFIECIASYTNIKIRSSQTNYNRERDVS